MRNPVASALLAAALAVAPLSVALAQGSPNSLGPATPGGQSGGGGGPMVGTQDGRTGSQSGTPAAIAQPNPMPSPAPMQGMGSTATGATPSVSTPGLGPNGAPR